MDFDDVLPAVAPVACWCSTQSVCIALCATRLSSCLSSASVQPWVPVSVFLDDCRSFFCPRGCVLRVRSRWPPRLWSSLHCKRNKASCRRSLVFLLFYPRLLLEVRQVFCWETQLVRVLGHFGSDSVRCGFLPTHSASVTFPRTSKELHEKSRLEGTQFCVSAGVCCPLSCSFFVCYHSLGFERISVTLFPSSRLASDAARITCERS